MYTPIKYTGVDRHVSNKGDTTEHKKYSPQEAASYAAFASSGFDTVKYQRQVSFELCEA